MQLVEFTSYYKTVVLFKASNFQFQYNNNYCNSVVAFLAYIISIYMYITTKKKEQQNVRDKLIGN